MEQKEEQEQQEPKKKSLDKSVKLLKQQLESLTSDEIRNQIKDNQLFNEYGQKMIDKRKEWSVKEFLSNQLMSIIYGGIIVFVFGIFYLGAMPAYYGVDNLFLNPINSSMGLNTSLDMINHAGYLILSDLIETGAQHPAIFFWLWWLLVFITFIYPLIRIILFFIRRGKHTIKKEVT